tara:strand:- start:1855 stop:2697 length:843 start_codon:yes stop_codon:yes gene_type:complete
MKAFEIIKIGSNLLKEKEIPSFILDSEILLSKTLKKSREEILINLNQKINSKEISIFKKYLGRRLNNEPIAYILGEKEFWSKKFNVNKNTLIPRPETELLVDELIKIYKEKKIIILDIGTGSGCIILSLLSSLKKSFGVGVDNSRNAILTAKKNAHKLELENRVKFFNVPLESVFNKKFDLVVSNPPYIEKRQIKNLSNDIKRHEPIMALDGGNDGLDLIKKVIYKSKYILKIKGLLALEIGNEQIKKVSKILFDRNFRIRRIVKDYKNNVRCVIAENNN